MVEHALIICTLLPNWICNWIWLWLNGSGWLALAGLLLQVGSGWFPLAGLLWLACSAKLALAGQLWLNKSAWLALAGCPQPKSWMEEWLFGLLLILNGFAFIV